MEASEGKDNIDLVSINKVSGASCQLDAQTSGDKIEVFAKGKGWDENVRGLSHESCDQTTCRSESECGEWAAGSLKITGTRAKIDFELGSGDVTIDGNIAELEGKVGSGQVTAVGVSGDTDIKTGAGSVNVTYTKVTPQADIDIKTGTGDIIF